MKILVLFTFFFCSNLYAHPNLQEVQIFLDQEAFNPSSKLNLKLDQLFVAEKSATKKIFKLNFPGQLIEKKLESYTECTDQNCKLWERKVFYKVSSIEFEYQRPPIYEFRAYFLEIPLISLEIWQTNLSGDKLNLIKKNFDISEIYLLNTN
jgi:hypothetical protein